MSLAERVYFGKTLGYFDEAVPAIRDLQRYFKNLWPQTQRVLFVTRCTRFAGEVSRHDITGFMLEQASSEAYQGPLASAISKAKKGEKAVVIANSDCGTAERAVKELFPQAEIL